MGRVLNQAARTQIATDPTGGSGAAIALAVVSTKDPAHFRTTAGGISTAWWQRRRPGRCTFTARCGPCGGPPSRNRAASRQREAVTVVHPSGHGDDACAVVPFLPGHAP
jgi:hypothetical protein